MTELDSRGRALLEQYQANQAAPPEVTDRVWEAVQTRAAAGDLGPELSGAEASAAGGASLAGKIGLGLGGFAVVVAVVAFATGPGASSTPEGPEQASPAPAVVSTEPDVEPDRDGVDAPAQTSTAASVSSEEPATAEASGPSDEELSSATHVPTRTKQDRKPAAQTDRRPSEPATTDADATTPELGPDLGPEVALMTKARAAMRAGEHQKALRLLDEHARTFPRGVFAKERELSRVTTLCGMGEHDAATEAARRFAQRVPSARERLEKTCAGTGI